MARKKWRVTWPWDDNSPITPELGTQPYVQDVQSSEQDNTPFLDGGVDPGASDKEIELLSRADIIPTRMRMNAGRQEPLERAAYGPVPGHNTTILGGLGALADRAAARYQIAALQKKNDEALEEMRRIQEQLMKNAYNPKRLPTVQPFGFEPEQVGSDATYSLPKALWD